MVALRLRRAHRDVCDHIGWVSRCSVRCGGKTSLRLSSSADGPPAATSKFRVRVWVRVRVRVGVRVRVKVRVRLWVRVRVTAQASA